MKGWAVSVGGLGLAALLSGCVAMSGSGPSAAAVPGLVGIQEEVARIRELPFREAVPSRTQSPDEFRRYVEREIRRQFGREGAEAYVRALVRLGALPGPLDLESMYLDLLEDQAAAHYDPEARAFYLLAADADPKMIELIASHELCHALQDQHHNLRQFIEESGESPQDNGDSATARQSLVEGEATVVMTIWMSMRQMKTDDPAAAVPYASMALKVQGAMDLDTVVSMASAGAMDLGFGSLGDSGRKLNDYPPYFVHPLLSAYLQGAVMVESVREQGGWKAVDALYANPPASTEQVLHPEKLQGQRDLPIDVRLQDLDRRLPRGWSLKEQDVTGELGIGVLLRQWQDKAAPDPAGAASAAAGWGGDRYYYCEQERGPGRLLLWRTVWDTEQDAAEFAVAYRSGLAIRFDAMAKAGQSGPGAEWVYQVWEVEPGRFLKLARKGHEVCILDTTDRSLVRAFWE